MTIQLMYDVSANSLPSPVIHQNFAPPFTEWLDLQPGQPLPEGGCWVIDTAEGRQVMLKIGPDRQYVIKSDQAAC